MIKIWTIQRNCRNTDRGLYHNFDMKFEMTNFKRNKKNWRPFDSQCVKIFGQDILLPGWGSTIKRSTKVVILNLKLNFTDTPLGLTLLMSCP